jgi:hypothetical protein
MPCSIATSSPSRWCTGPRDTISQEEFNTSRSQLCWLASFSVSSDIPFGPGTSSSLFLLLSPPVVSLDYITVRLYTPTDPKVLLREEIRRV